MKGKKDNKQTTHTGFVFQNLPFLALLGLFSILYIANSHYAEKQIRKINSLKKEVEELRWEYNSIQSDIQYSSTYTQLRSRVDQKISINDVALPKKVKVAKGRK
jgi:hypothetical protein